MRDGVVLTSKGVVLRESDLDTLRGPCYLTDQVIAFYFSYLSSSYETDDILLVSPSLSCCLANFGVSEDVSDSYKLSSRKLVLFVVNDCDDFDGVDDRGTGSGSHWSILVYSRSMNEFLHLDSMRGVNSHSAEKLYNAVKDYMGLGGEVPRKKTSTSKKKQPNINKKKEQPITAPVGEPVFKEWKHAPKQFNGYDCGIYVLAIARAIIDWFSGGMDSESDVFSVVAKHVDQSVEVRMRSEILKLIDDLRENPVQ